METQQFTFNTGVAKLMFVKLPEGSYDIKVENGELKATYLTEVSGIPVPILVSIEVPKCKMIGTMDVLEDDDDAVEPYVKSEVVDYNSQSLRNVYGSDKFIEYKNYREDRGTWPSPSQSFCSIFDRKIKGKKDDWYEMKDSSKQWVALQITDISMLFN